jgi:multidrug resistance efflux pump
MLQKAESPGIQTKTLFRKEVLENTQTQGFGPLLMTVPLSYECIGWFVTIFMGLFILWSILINFQEKTTVQGYLDVKPGLVQVFPKTTGIVVKRMVRLGQTVKRGDRLLKIRTSFDGISKQRVAAMSRKLDQLNEEIKKAQAQLIQYQNLVQHHFLSQYDYEQREKKVRLLEQASTQLNVNIMQAKLAQSYVMTAPIAGTVSQIETQVGQSVSGTQSLLTIRPATSRWVAYLLVPMQAIRFVTRFQAVNLRYDAYPFHQFGSINGQIMTTPNALSGVDRSHVPVTMRKPFYRIEVKLSEPHLRWHGEKLPLFQGMTIEAILSGRKQRIWAWLRQLG